MQLLSDKVYLRTYSAFGTSCPISASKSKRTASSGVSSRRGSCLFSRGRLRRSQCLLEFVVQADISGLPRVGRQSPVVLARRDFKAGPLKAGYFTLLRESFWLLRAIALSRHSLSAQDQVPCPARRASPVTHINYASRRIRGDT